jgi:hypothetical protein
VTRVLVVDDVAQCIGVQDTDMALLDFNDFVVDELRKGAAYGFEFET